jgi:hypothetical protein
LNNSSLQTTNAISVILSDIQNNLNDKNNKSNKIKVDDDDEDEEEIPLYTSE